MLRKEDEAQVDPCFLLPSYITNTSASRKEDEAQVDCYLLPQSRATKILPSGEQTSHSGA